MKTKNISFLLLFLVFSLAFLFLSGCNLTPNAGQDSTDLDSTQAYQTVNAQLTQAVAQTPVPATKTPLPDLPSATATSELASTPTATQLAAEPTATFLPTYTHTPATRCDQAEAAFPSIDITIPDDTEIPAGQAFTKVWRVVNTGTCNWTAEYATVFATGDQMGAPEQVAITEPVAPGQSIDISVTMTAPLEPGTYQGNWQLRNAAGEVFGLGPNGTQTFWVRIIVVSGETPTPTGTLAPTPNVVVNGTVTLNPNENVDLDTLQLNAAGSDLAYQQIKNGEVISGHQLVPLSGVTVGIFGAGQPSLEECQNMDMNSAPIDLENVAVGNYFCYITNQGLPGWGRYDALDSEEDGTVTITVLTWAILEP